MRKSILAVVPLALLVAGLPLAASAQSTQKTATKAQSSASFDPHDLSGVWVTKRQAGVNIVDDKTRPPMTAWAKARYDETVPTLGPRAQPGKDNDPTLFCAPDGVPKLFTSPEPFEIFMVPGRVLELFEKDHNTREIWTDGRALPKDPDPTWYGTSVGHWEGDEFVVDSDGFNDKTWLTYFGDQHSDQMHLTERYKRTGPDTMTIQVIITDPKAYTAPWVSPPKEFTKHPDWEIHEWYCTPAQFEQYDQSIRYPAGVKGSGPPPEDAAPSEPSK